MPVIHIQFKSGRGLRKWEIVLGDTSTPPLGHFCHYSHEAEAVAFFSLYYETALGSWSGGAGGNHSAALFKINLMFNLFHSRHFIYKILEYNELMIA